MGDFVCCSSRIATLKHTAEMLSKDQYAHRVFSERARIEPAHDGYRGYVPELPTILVTAETAEQCRAKLAGAIATLGD